MTHKELTFVHRTNIKKENSEELDLINIKELYNQDLVSINIRSNEIDDSKNLDLLLQGNNPKKVSGYIKQFHNLYLASLKYDILVYAKYLGYNSKLGLIKKGTEIKTIKKQDQIFYCLKLSDIKNIDKSDYPLLETVIPFYLTVSAVKKGRDKLISIFYDEDLPHKLENLSDKATELMCAEWLRSDFNKDNKVKYQLMPTGGNNADIDFLGKTIDNKILASQITTSNNKKTLDDKVEKLNNFNANYKVMFGQLNDYKTDKVEYIPIQKVWGDFVNSDYTGLIDFLINK